MKNSLILFFLICSLGLPAQSIEKASIPHMYLSGKILDSAIAFENVFSYKRITNKNYYYKDTLKESLEANIYVYYNDTVEFYKSERNGFFAFPLQFSNIIYKIVFSKKGYKSKMIEIDTKKSGLSKAVRLSFFVDLSIGKNKSKVIPVVRYTYQKKTNSYECQILNDDSSWRQDEEKGTLSLLGETLSSNKVGLKTRIYIKLLKDSASYSMLFAENSEKFKILLMEGKEYLIAFASSNYKSKVILIDTRNSGNSKFGYEFPLDITLKKGKNIIENIKPVAIIYYDKKSNLYKSSLTP